MRLRDKPQLIYTTDSLTDTSMDWGGDFYLIAARFPYPEVRHLRDWPWWARLWLRLRCRRRQWTGWIGYKRFVVDFYRPGPLVRISGDDSFRYPVWRQVDAIVERVRVYLDRPGRLQAGLGTPTMDPPAGKSWTGAGLDLSELRTYQKAAEARLAKRSVQAARDRLTQAAFDRLDWTLKPEQPGLGGFPKALKMVNGSTIVFRRWPAAGGSGGSRLPGSNPAGRLGEPEE